MGLACHRAQKPQTPLVTQGSTCLLLCVLARLTPYPPKSLCYLRLRQLMKEDTCVLCKTVMDRVMVCNEENIR